MTSGGAGVDRALRMSTAYGRRTDHRNAVATTCKVTTIAAQTTASSSETVGSPARAAARTTLTVIAVSRISASTIAREANTSLGDTGRLSRHSAPRPSRNQAFTP